MASQGQGKLKKSGLREVRIAKKKRGGRACRIR